MSLTHIVTKNSDKNPVECTQPRSHVVPGVEHNVTPSPFDPDSLRLSSADSAGIRLDRVIIDVPVGKPNKQEFMRTYRDTSFGFDTMILQDLADRQCYLISLSLKDQPSAEISPIHLVIVITSHGSLFLWLAVIPFHDGRSNRWHDSMAIAKVRAANNLTQVKVETSLNEHLVDEARVVLPEPEWPERTFGEILKLAF